MYNKYRNAVGLTLLITGAVPLISGIITVIGQSLHFLLSPEDVGIVMPAFMLAVMLGNPFFGRRIDRVGERRLLSKGLPLMLVTLCGYPLVFGSTPALTLVSILYGITYSLVTNAVFLLVVRSVSKRHQARITALTAAFIDVGAGLAAYATFWLVGTDSPWHFVIGLGIFSVVLVFAGIAFIEDSWGSWGRQMKSALRWFTWSHAKKFVNKVAFLLSLPGVGINAAYMSFVTWFANYWPEQPGMVLLVANCVNAAVALTVMPWYAKKPKSYFPLMVGSHLIMVVCLLLIWRGNSLPIMLLAGILIGVVICAYRLGIREQISRRVSSARHGVAFATFNCMVQLGGMIGTGYSSPMWDSLRGGMWLSMLPLLVLSFFTLLFIGKKGIEVDETIEVQPPLSFSVRYEAALAQMCGNEKRSSQVLNGEVSVESYLEEEENFELRCTELALECLETVKLLKSSLPVDGAILRLQMSFLERLQKHDLDVVTDYASRMGYPKNKTITKTEIGEVHEYILTKVRMGGQFNYDHRGEILTEQPVTNGMFEGGSYVFPEYHIPDLLKAVLVLDVVDVSRVVEAYEKEALLLLLLIT